jgi:CRISPR-associated protein Cas1
MAISPEPDPSPVPAEPELPRPKRLPRAPMGRSAAPELVPARMINEALYCERLLYLEWAQGEFADNVFTVEGRFVHRRADEPGGELPPKPKKKKASADAQQGSDDDPPLVDEPRDDEPRPYQARSLWLSSETLGMTAKIDVVEGDASGRVVPIEYKRGMAPDVREGAYLPERAQLCAQVLLLREHGYTCDEAAIYFAGSRQRVPIVIDAELIETTRRAAARARLITSEALIPAPLVDSPKCQGCSLIGICLPDEVNLLRRLETGEMLDDESTPSEAEARPPLHPDLEGPLAIDPWELAGTIQPEGFALRRLHPARDDKLPLYVQEQGARIGLSGDCLIATGRTTGRVEARLSNTSQVCVYGQVQISTQALRELLVRGIPLSFFSSGGWYYGRATGVDSKNVELRIAQHRGAADPALCLRLAQGFVTSKIKNSRTLLRRNHEQANPVVLSELDQLAYKSARAESLPTLLGLEGAAARVYFGAFEGMLKGDAARAGTFAWEGRNRRPPKDPINALLSFAYALLARDLSVTLAAVGLDPLLGFYHQPRFGRAALALDLMEEFRPLIADSMVLGALNTGVVTDEDFLCSAGGVAIKPPARRRIIQAYERRMDQLVTHPVFGYRVSYRRVLEVQSRLLGRVLLGEIEHYPAFRTR